MYYIYPNYLRYMEFLMECKKYDSQLPFQNSYKMITPKNVKKQNLKKTFCAGIRMKTVISMSLFKNCF